LTNFQTFFPLSESGKNCNSTVTVSLKSCHATRLLSLKILSHLKCVATLPYAIFGPPCIMLNSQHTVIDSEELLLSLPRRDG